jgi:hypothetical protein
MLEYLRTSGKPSERKLRLLACACVRRGAWHRLRDHRCQKAIETRERFEDELANATELKEVQLEVWWVWLDAFMARSMGADAVRSVAEAVGQPIPPVSLRLRVSADSNRWLTRPAAVLACETEQWVERVLECAVRAATYEGHETASSHVRETQCLLVRCIFGNPFRLVTFDPAWRWWNGGAAVVLAKDMHESRNFRQAPLLADMLEDAGATDTHLLDHLRGPGPHARGCFAIDLVLEKA